MSHDIIAEVVRRMVEGFSADIEAVQVGVIDDRTPDAARRVLAAALNYIADPADLMPDSYEGIGIMDDAAIIRLAAQAAVHAGADDEALRRLAREADDLDYIFGDLTLKLYEFLAKMQRPDEAGRTPIDVISDPESRMQLWRRLNERRESSRADSLAALAMDAGELVKTMRSVMRGRLGRAGS